VETAAGKIFSLSGRIVALPFRPLRPLRDRLSNLFGRVVTSLRSSLNQSFTVLAAASGVLVAGSLVVILLPMLYKGCGAVVFQGTVEFRRMQLEQFKRGDGAEIQAETASANEVRAGVYAILDNFRHGIDTSDLQERARYVYRELGKQLQNRNLDAAQYASTRSLAKDLRDNLLAAYETSDKVEALKRLDAVLAFAGEPSLAGTRAQEFFEMAKDYRRTAETIDLSRRAEYAVQFREVQQIVRDLLGPRPGDPAAPIILEQYGATRMDRAEFLLDRLVWMDEWVSDGEGKPLVKVRVHRQKAFRGTELAGLFEYVESHAKEMLRPRWTFYWQYFLDDSVSSHYFGGVGPEIAGTLALAVLAILFALPLGVVAAAYLVECAGDNHFVNVIRTCVNTLAGVPSIVFGLFGLAFFVIFLLPLLGMSEGSSILAGALTLALLVLPIIIRASEEAIRSVPQSFREASLALGASRFRGFVTVTLPAALPGILTGVILSVSRAAGETAPILFTAAVALGPPLWTQGWGALGHPTRTLSYSSYDIAVSDKLAAMAPHNQFGMVMTLVALVLALNILAIVVRSRMVKRLRGQ
jgi:phosphate transport system permease protein